MSYLDKILGRLAAMVADNVALTMKQEIRIMSDALQSLTEKVAKNTEITQSAITLIQGLADEVRQLNANGTGATAEEINALATKIADADTALAAAVSANTPAAPAVAPEAPPAPATPPTT